MSIDLFQTKSNVSRLQARLRVRERPAVLLYSFVVFISVLQPRGHIDNKERKGRKVQCPIPWILVCARAGQ